MGHRDRYQADADQILAEMNRVRRDLNSEVGNVVRSARQAMDWRTYLRAYPIAAMVVAGIVGYWLVPVRRPRTPVPQSPRSPVNNQVAPGLVGVMSGMLLQIGIRTLTSYASQRMVGLLLDRFDSGGGQSSAGASAGQRVTPNGSSPGRTTAPRNNPSPRRGGLSR